jgi:hypothetical protein
MYWGSFRFVARDLGVRCTMAPSRTRSELVSRRLCEYLRHLRRCWIWIHLLCCVASSCDEGRKPSKPAIRSGLKIRRPSGLGGSTPPPGTIILVAFSITYVFNCIERIAMAPWRKIPNVVALQFSNDTRTTERARYRLVNVGRAWGRPRTLISRMDRTGFLDGEPRRIAIAIPL